MPRRVTAVGYKKCPTRGYLLVEHLMSDKIYLPTAKWLCHPTGGYLLVGLLMLTNMIADHGKATVLTVEYKKSNKMYLPTANRLRRGKEI